MVGTRLVLADRQYKKQYLEMISECKEDIFNLCFDSVMPVSSEETFETDMKKLDNERQGIDLQPGWVPASSFWLLDDEDVLIGAISLRHQLTERLRFRGGHISYYVRPSKRHRGYATKMLSLALDKCRELGLTRVLITCLKDNIYSAKTIQRNGGVLDSEDNDNGQTIQRYWIDLSKSLLNAK